MGREKIKSHLLLYFLIKSQHNMDIKFNDQKSKLYISDSK